MSQQTPDDASVAFVVDAAGGQSNVFGGSRAGGASHNETADGLPTPSPPATSTPAASHVATPPRVSVRAHLVHVVQWAEEGCGNATALASPHTGPAPYAMSTAWFVARSGSHAILAAWVHAASALPVAEQYADVAASHVVARSADVVAALWTPARSGVHAAWERSLAPAWATASATVSASLSAWLVSHDPTLPTAGQAHVDDLAASTVDAFVTVVAVMIMGRLLAWCLGTAVWCGTCCCFCGLCARRPAPTPAPPAAKEVSAAAQQPDGPPSRPLTTDAPPAQQPAFGPPPSQPAPGQARSFSAPNPPTSGPAPGGKGVIKLKPIAVHKATGSAGDTLAHRIDETHHAAAALNGFGEPPAADGWRAPPPTAPPIAPAGPPSGPPTATSGSAGPGAFSVGGAPGAARMPPLRHAPAPQRAGGAWSGLGGLSARGVEGGPPGSARSGGGGVDTRASSPATLDMGMSTLPVQPTGADSLAMDSARSERPADSLSHPAAATDNPFGGGGLRFVPAPASAHTLSPASPATTADAPPTDSSRSQPGGFAAGAGGDHWGGVTADGHGLPAAYDPHAMAGHDGAFQLPSVHTGDASGEYPAGYDHSGAPTGSTEMSASAYNAGEGLEAGALSTDGTQSGGDGSGGEAASAYQWDTPYEVSGQWLVMSSAHGVWIAYEDWAAYHNALAAGAAGSDGGAGGEHGDPHAATGELAAEA
jgi:hypothetical protein